MPSNETLFQPGFLKESYNIEGDKKDDKADAEDFKCKTHLIIQ